ncbi:tetratricopeptide repeat protein [Mariprofundus erugo]|uniref:Tetratricopeptide repeat protein n=1 Tax=Mariprofundus erugo TaxID=2528639 RepID=A0A5R9GPU8_9PROT|nr:tetratricopeptide repeat protein [Mariprofundus erugo]TLS67618.1 tetratricopeptide repeat protein [Mariprofundus erugo]
MKYYCRLVALTSLLTLAACVTTTPQDTAHRDKLASLHYQIGVDALGKGLLPKAFDELMESDSIRPDQPEVLDALAYAWLMRGDMAKSESYYLKALRQGGGAATQNNYASLLNRLNRYDEAEKAARTALNDPRYSNQDLAFINLGNAMAGQKNYPAAIDAFRQALQFNPANNLANLRLADTYAAAGDLLQAQALYEALIQSQPQSRDTVAGLVQVLVAQHKIDDAQRYLNHFSKQSESVADRAWSIEQINRLPTP